MNKAKRILELHNKKQEVNKQHKELLSRYGFDEKEKDIKRQTSEAFYKMFEAKNKNNDYDVFIELEKNHVSYNLELIQIGKMSENTIVLNDKFGNKVEVTKTRLKIGDSVVIVDNEKEFTLLSHIPTKKYVIGTIDKIINDGGFDLQRIKIKEMGGSWDSSVVYKIKTA